MIPAHSRVWYVVMSIALLILLASIFGCLARYL